MDNNNITVQANLDTTQLKKDLEKFKGEINLSAVTKPMLKQIDTALKDASKNASISFKCSATGLRDIENQVSSARSQVQKLQTEFNSLPKSSHLNISVDSSGLKQYTTQYDALPKQLNLNVSVNSSGLQQYTTQLQNALKLQAQLSNLSMPTSAISSSSTNGTTPLSGTGIIPAQAEKETLSLSSAFNKLTETGKTFTSWFNTAGIINTAKNMGTKLGKNLD